MSFRDEDIHHISHASEKSFIFKSRKARSNHSRNLKCQAFGIT